ncbi:MAG: U32 family peptidase [bacterium]
MRELLAPAKDLEKLKIALLYGADAVYIGGRNFSLRANATNFSLEELKEAVDFAHALNKKVYITVNIVFHDEDFEGLLEYLKYLEEIKIDGVIVSDIAVVDMIKENELDLFIVLSTQASSINEYNVAFWQSLGVKRVVLGRECDKEEIKRVIENTGVEAEVFVHGAMCTSFSGKCLLSNKTTLRDANRGGCAQVCRWCFKNKENPEFSMMSKDLNMIENIQEMFSLGVVSYKIEGRMRSVYYLATVVGVYRKIFDLVSENKLTKEDQEYFLKILNRVANRESKAQFFNNLPDETDQYFFGRTEETNKDFLAIVKEYDKDSGMVTLEQRNYFKKGDKVQFFNPKFEINEYTVNEIFDKDDNLIEIANHPKMIIKVKVDFELKENDFMRISIQ